MQLATKGLESTTFALLAGFANFGNTVASQARSSMSENEGGWEIDR